MGCSRLWAPARSRERRSKYTSIRKAPCESVVRSSSSSLSTSSSLNEDRALPENWPLRHRPSMRPLS